MKQLKKGIAVISDIHGNSWALQAVLRDIRQRGIRYIVNLGDCFYGPLDPGGTAQLLMPLNIPTVRGNEDRVLVDMSIKAIPSSTIGYTRECLQPQHLEWLKTLPLTAEFGEDFLLFHGSPRRDDEYVLVEVLEDKVAARTPGDLASILEPYKQGVFLCGHDHVSRFFSLPGGKLIVDPGSVGLQAYTDDLPWPHAMETYSPHARYSIIHESEQGWQVENIALPYDWGSAAEAAEKNDRPDWARWLMTGRAL